MPILRNPICTNMKKLNNMVAKSANTDLPVLIIGEDGVGKHTYVKHIHACSEKASCELATVNANNFDGVFSNGIDSFDGTLFIEDISNISVAQQTLLLKHVSENPKFRLIASSEIPLEYLVKSGDFSEELYHYIAIVNLKLPPLRERKDDIPLLADGIIRELNSSYGKNKRLNNDVLEMLSQRTWHGNIAELKDVLSYAYGNNTGEEITADGLMSVDESSDVNKSVSDELYSVARMLAQSAENIGSGTLLKDYNDLVMPPLLKALLHNTNGNKTNAAKLLGVTRNTLNKYLREFKIEE